MMKKRGKNTAGTSAPKIPESMAALAEGMADDFNNILTTVMGACSLIDKDSAANAELLQYVALIRSSAERAAALSDKLMRAGSVLQKNDACISDVKLSNTKKTSVRDKYSNNGIVSPNDDHPGGVPS
jgi:nitrogen-specific signal transduction histidine kinase